MKSEVRSLGLVSFPKFSGLRIMMMPFVPQEPSTLPKFMWPWVETVREMLDWIVKPSGVGYLTIDEAHVAAGENHRRPGLHVDGCGSWGGGGGWGKRGMVVASSHYGCDGWNQDVDGEPIGDGDCAHLESKLLPEKKIEMLGGHAYWCGPMAVHKAVPMERDTFRQFVRISMPSDAPWFEGYTENPLGIKPAGPILPRRPEMDFRP